MPLLISDLIASFFGQENINELLSRVQEIVPIESQKYEEVVSVRGNIELSLGLGQKLKPI